MVEWSYRHGSARKSEQLRQRELASAQRQSID
jgi:hypothetical protein